LPIILVCLAKSYLYWIRLAMEKGSRKRARIAEKWGKKWDKK
jgi:hypothetical protein